MAERTLQGLLEGLDPESYEEGELRATLRALAPVVSTHTAKPERLISRLE